MVGKKRTFKRWVDDKFQRWLVKQLPASNLQWLKRTNIFILPTRFGYAYLFFAAIMFVLGTNYQNNLIILISFILISCFITVMIQSYQNLAQLKLSVTTNIITGFCTEKLFLPLSVSSSRPKFNINFNFQDEESTRYLLLSEDKYVKVPFSKNERGLHTLSRVVVSTYYPMGLFRVWTKLDFGVNALIYPKPKKPPVSFLHQLISLNEDDSKGDQHREVVTRQEGIDEFSELKRYQRGESLAKVAWKQVAKGQEWHTKHYLHVTHASPDWLSLDMFPAADIETRLRWLTFLVLSFEKQEIPFGLKLGDKLIEPSGGKIHCQGCLKNIATYGQRNE